MDCSVKAFLSSKRAPSSSVGWQGGLRLGGRGNSECDGKNREDYDELQDRGRAGSAAGSEETSELLSRLSERMASLLGDSYCDEGHRGKRVGIGMACGGREGGLPARNKLGVFRHIWQHPGGSG
uniref:Uncharacterized protein n=1 Tax=Chromera velia CCMP2878 TaxID=1169474 RepID=A0A0G4HAJ5_9ALVE|eukprot:Cvel_6109.t1-p1 / transcript=Cvel_6109.t1 / gene=Cvel_6109 / organism=Chromera_velia_CCMP2878 / gene_product=hypothetical protein / transcript_product=hypothetical protein / location=Cvel_scaffold295:5554-5922(-) / protein_length=123 / sequence_SO=supercontig / SO=protein_coding / is_pseudo=false